MPSTFASENTPVKEKPKAVSTGDKIYTWVDEQGNRIYSDVPREGAEVMEIFHGIVAQGRTIIMVTHNPEYSKEAERVILLHDGAIV